MSRRVPAFVTKHANLERMWNFGMFVMERIDKASLKQVASSLTLTTLLSIVPALAVIMAAFSAFPLFAPYREAFEQFIFSSCFSLRSPATVKSLSHISPSTLQRMQ